MREFLSGIVMLMHVLLAFADNINCNSAIVGYKTVANSRFPFSVDGKKACFFAFFTPNPDPTLYPNGNGNRGDTVWYGYYELSNPDKIYEFPKPSDTDWCRICRIEAISFWDMNGDKKPDVTIIGSCDSNVTNQTFPLVFIRSGNKYILNEDVYMNLYGYINLTVADVRGYIKSSSRGSYRKVLERRSDWRN